MEVAKILGPKSEAVNYCHSKLDSSLNCSLIKAHLRQALTSIVFMAQETCQSAAAAAVVFSFFRLEFAACKRYLFHLRWPSEINEAFCLAAVRQITHPRVSPVTLHAVIFFSFFVPFF